MQVPELARAIIHGRGRGRCQRDIYDEYDVPEPGRIRSPVVDRTGDFEDPAQTGTLILQLAVKPGQFDDSPTDVPQITISGPPPDPLFSYDIIAELRGVLEEGYGLAKEISQEVREDKVWNQNYILVNFCTYGPGHGSGRSIFVPGEVTLTAFTLENGMIEQYHTFIDPGPGPRGEVNNADLTLIDRWPKGLRRRDYDVKYQNVDRILTEMEAFIEKHKNSDGSLPKLLCFQASADWTVVLGCFNWLYLWRKCDLGASYNRGIAKPPVIWFFGELAHKLLLKISKDMLTDDQLTYLKVCRLDWKVVHLNGFHPEEFFELLPNIENAIPQGDESLKHRIQHDRGFTGTLFLQRRNFYNAQHADEYFKNGVMLPPKDLCCEYHFKGAPSTMFCTKAVGALAVRDLMDCLTYVKGHYV